LRGLVVCVGRRGNVNVKEETQVRRNEGESLVMNVEERARFVMTQEDKEPT
jgi:hypothetical protein